MRKEEWNMIKPKCSIIVDEELPPGLVANTVGVIAMALGKLAPEAMGHDGVDQDGKRHCGLAWMGVTVLRGTKEVIGDIFTRVAENDPDLLIVDCPAVAQATRDYDEYLEMLSQQGGPELRLSGIGLYGNGKMIAKLTGTFPCFARHKISCEQERYEHMERIVFLDRNLLQTSLRTLAFDHHWQEYPSTRPDEVVARLQGATIAITNRVVLSEPVLADLPSLRFIAIVGTGTDCVDLEACQRRGILVSNTREWCTSSVTEHVFALILALRRHLILLDQGVKQGAWQRSGSAYLSPPSIPDELAGGTIGIIGYGTLGRSVERLAHAFGMRAVIAEHKGRSQTRPGYTPWLEVLRQSDILAVLCPLTEETRGLLGEEEFRVMNVHALLINCARGGFVDERALASALQIGAIAGAGVDVLSSEPPDQRHVLLDLHHPRLIVTPHLTWMSHTSLRNLADQLIENIEAFVQGRPRHLVLANCL